LRLGDGVKSPQLAQSPRITSSESTPTAKPAAGLHHHHHYQQQQQRRRRQLSAQCYIRAPRKKKKHEQDASGCACATRRTRPRALLISVSFLLRIDPVLGSYCIELCLLLLRIQLLLQLGRLRTHAKQERPGL